MLNSLLKTFSNLSSFSLNSGFSSLDISLWRSDFGLSRTVSGHSSTKSEPSFSSSFWNSGFWNSGLSENLPKLCIFPSIQNPWKVAPFVEVIDPNPSFFPSIQNPRKVSPFVLVINPDPDGTPRQRPPSYSSLSSLSSKG